jgi:hypothetical protein
MKTADTNLRVIRLKNGDDIMAEVTTEIHATKKTIKYTLRNPMRVMYIMANGGTSISVAMVEWMFRRVSEDEEVMISEDNIMFEAIPTKALQEYYWNYLEAAEDRVIDLENMDTDFDSSEKTSYIADMLEEIKKKGGKLN